MTIIGRGFGVSGETSTQNLTRINDVTLNERRHGALPALALIYTGVNDPAASISQATTQANLQAMIKALKYGAFGAGPLAGLDASVTAADQTALPATGMPGDRVVVLNDTSTTGGLVSTTATPRLGGTVTGQTVWECDYPLAGVNGWHRVKQASDAPTHVQRIAVVSANYLNHTSGGDTPSTPYATYATVRAAQAAAVAAENVTVGGVASVVFVDLYAFQRNRIVAGTDPNFSADTAIVAHTAYTQALSWHEADLDQHHGAYGHWLVAQATLAAIPAAWVTALKALPRGYLAAMGDSQTAFDGTTTVDGPYRWVPQLATALNAP